MPEKKDNIPAVERLARALAAPHDEQACAECLDALEAYVGAQLDGEAYAERFPAVAEHLDRCVACAEAYALLYETHLAAEQLPAPSRVPAPDLGFLTPSATPIERAAERAALIATAIARAGSQLRLALSQALLDLLPPPASVPALRGEPRVLLELSIPVADPAVAEIALAAYRLAGAGEQCDLRVRVVLHGRDWPDLAQIPIELWVGERRERALTDPWGEAVFEGIPVADLPRAIVAVEVA
jgi:hypothetical protein